jgi:large subunit ribosomal protein L18
MAYGPNYKVKYRRRREGKTNYYKRYIYVLSRAIRAVVRKTNKYILVQIVKFDPKGDITIAASHSIELAKKYGWKGDLNNTQAAYLTGYLAGLRAIKKGIQNAVVDIGLHRPTKGARVFAAIKGAIDAGMRIKVGDVLPDDSRIQGEHIARYAVMLEQSNPEMFKRLFSRYLERGLHPKELPNHFKEILNKIKETEGVNING